jgi:hypothetical protein
MTRSPARLSRRGCRSRGASATPSRSPPPDTTSVYLATLPDDGPSGIHCGYIWTTDSQGTKTSCPGDRERADRPRAGRSGACVPLPRAAAALGHAETVAVAWIARTYLHLPASLSLPLRPARRQYPRGTRGCGMTRRGRPGSRNFAELMQVAEGLRHAADTTNASADPGSWLRLMSEADSSTEDIAGTQRARYETTRGRLCAKCATRIGAGWTLKTRHPAASLLVAAPAGLAAIRAALGHAGPARVHRVAARARMVSTAVSRGRVSRWTCARRSPPWSAASSVTARSSGLTPAGRCPAA